MRLEVTDTGIGIEREALERLFIPFAQADSSTTRTHGGTGLGLAISRQLIELMGGKLGATSEPGKGSTFWFELALERAEGKLDPPDEEHDLAGLRVLVVDDNASSREILARQLGSLQMSCEVADNAAHAMARLAAAAGDGIPYQLALIDWEMPGVDGFELAHTIRRRSDLSGIRLLLLGSSGGVSDAPGEPLHGFDGLLTKPVRQSRLFEEIRAVITGEPRAPTARRGAGCDRRRRAAPARCPTSWWSRTRRSTRRSRHACSRRSASSRTSPRTGARRWRSWRRSPSPPC